MTTLFTIHATPSPKLFGKPSVKAVQASTPYGGLLRSAENDFVKPDPDAVRECLPYKWRAAWDRSGQHWTNDDPAGHPEREAKHYSYLHLQDSRGGYMATLYAYPYDFN